MKIPQISKQEFLESIRDGVEQAILTMTESGDGYRGMTIREPFLSAIEKGVFEAIQNREILNKIELAVSGDEKMKEDSVLERIAHELFHLVEVITRLSDNVEHLGGATDELGMEIHKHRLK